MGECSAYNKYNIMKHKICQLTKGCGHEVPATGNFITPKANTAKNYIKPIKRSHTYLVLFLQ